MNMSSVPTTNAMDTIPASSTPTNWVDTMVRAGNTSPHAPTPTEFHTKSRVVLWAAYSSS